MSARQPRSRQAGAAFLMFVVVLALIGVSLVLGASTRQAQLLAQRSETDRQAYLNDSAARLSRWYAAHLAVIDSQPGAPEITDALTGAGIARRLGLEAAASARIQSGQLAYHVFVLWIPAAMPDPSAWEPSTGAFRPGPGVRYAVVSGAPLEAAALAATRQALVSFANQLESYFAARAEHAGGDTAVNYFRAASCTDPAGIPCLDTYTAATTIDWARLGLEGVPRTDAWGQPLEVSNGQDANTTAPPFSIALRDRTPFGTVLAVTAIQRL